ncbi:MAG: hypothetical protein JWO71_4047 [Candidatus Acidoferrum typicum]|nr:hypothetical protein [Candidatus Acidoferrum typicum]
MSQAKKILYRGVPMIEGWPEKIMAAQEIVSLTLKGRAIPRIRYGDEHSGWGANQHPCGDCAVFKGELHVPSCDIEECPSCGEQLITCACAFDEDAEDA